MECDGRTPEDSNSGRIDGASVCVRACVGGPYCEVVSVNLAICATSALQYRQSYAENHSQVTNHGVAVPTFSVGQSASAPVATRSLFSVSV
jgi:hypothetical protein